MTRATKTALLGLGAVGLLGGALALGVSAQADKLAPGLRVGGVNVGGLSPDAALAAVRGQAQAQAPQVEVKAGGKSWTLSAEKLGYQVDPQASLDAARKLSDARPWSERALGVLGQSKVQDVPLVTKVDPAVAQATIGKLTAGLATQPVNATVGFDPGTRRYAVLTPDTPGRKANAQAAAKGFAADPTKRVLNVPMTEWPARYTAAALAKHAELGNRLMRGVTFKLEGSNRSGSLAPLQVANLYWVKPEGIVLDDKTIKGAFESLSYQLDQPAQNARYAWRGGAWGKVGEKPGRVTDPKKGLEAFRKGLLDPARTTITFPSVQQQPTLKLADLPNPAKLELIASGTSTYYGSSAERRTNIANAAGKIDGTVVAAGEDFSFLQALGSISPENGFVGGLIISGGRTVDGLGGGVCQVSTTAFRALYQAGLPIVERNQHSYRVKYYEPQVGFEAAVYDPGVDLKMKNDTGAPILVRSVNNDAASRLEIQIWGTRPQRTVSVSPAVILSRTPHPAPQYVFNPKLPAGTSKQVDWAQDGYNLYITRTIKDAQGTRTDRVDTRYKPWQAVYEYGPRLN
ncbi:VanW family protein [Deinococcus wulumuqiensis]|uniref:VanW family protein n=1 Tax=Deinococcus wulumuqiensis TaxID=980427 RepID=UPI0024323BD9|nr:VanW family protein [Deinococcus wulumuqiensis]